MEELTTVLAIIATTAGTWGWLASLTFKCGKMEYQIKNVEERLKNGIHHELKQIRKKVS